MPPKVNSFASSYEAQSDAADIDSKVDDSLKSFMAQGDSAFENEDVDGNGLSRQDVISGVRENILKRLDEENKGSRKEADRMKDDHDAYSGDIVGDISSMQRTVRTIAETRDNLAALEEREENDTSNAVFKFFKFRGIRKRNARKKIESLNSKKREQIRKIREKAGKWSAVRSDYAKNKVRKRYKTYDALAKSWYELTHERAVSALPEDATDEAKRAAMENRAIPEAYEKNIIEYTGVYQMSALDTMLQVAEETPDFALNIQNIPKAPYKDSRNAGTGDDYLTKSHKKILMLSEADENTGIKTRFKFDASFLGNRAKSQFVAADTEETALLEGDALPQGDADNRMYAEDAGLESDRKDINGRFLFSEKNAEILHARLKRNGRTVYGFYQNGEFLTNDEEGETLDNGETRVSGKKDMKFFGRRNWNKQEDAEKLRVAIRTSPFFQHVNSRTIQYYAGYEAASDYVDTIEEVMEKKWEDSDVGRDDAVSALREAPDRLDNIPDSVKGPALAEYLKESVTEEGQPAFPLADPATDPVLGYAINNHKKILQTACLILLASDDGRLWVLAKNIIIKVPKIANRRTRIKMKYLPSEGMLMRMALLDEMVKYKGNSDFSEDEDDEEFDLMESAGATFTGKQVLQEELDSKRGAGNWIKRNLLNGKIIKTALSATSTGFDFADNLGDTIDYAKNDGYKDETSDEREERKEKESEEKDKRLERKFWFAYGETLAESNEVVGILSGAGTLAGFIAGGSETATIARDIGFQVQDVLDIVNNFMYLFKAIKNFFRKKTDEEKEAERTGLQDLDATKARKFFKFINAFIEMINCGRDLASYHVAEETGFGTIVNEAWGNLLAYKGPLDFALTTAQNIIAIIQDIIEMVTASKRINRIDAADKDIETAISLYNKEPDNKPRIHLAGAAGEERDRIRNLGNAARQNSQAQYFMSLTKASSRKNRSKAGWDIASKTLSIAKDSFAMFVDPSGSLLNKIVKTTLSIGPKLVDFIGWTVGKLKYDRGTFKDNIASMLGDKSYAKTDYFDKVLKRETGIVSSAYLVDLARIFTSIDTHAMINKEDASDGEKELSKTVVSTLYGNVNDENVKRIKLSSMLKYAGFSGDSDWRTLLRNSIKE